MITTIAWGQAYARFEDGPQLMVLDARSGHELTQLRHDMQRACDTSVMWLTGMAIGQDDTQIPHSEQDSSFRLTRVIAKRENG